MLCVREEMLTGVLLNPDVIFVKRKSKQHDGEDNKNTDTSKFINNTNSEIKLSPRQLTVGAVFTFKGIIMYIVFCLKILRRSRSWIINIDF